MLPCLRSGNNLRTMFKSNPAHAAAQANSAMKRTKLGISPLSWTNEGILELGDDISYETCIAEASRAGFTGIELGRKFPKQPEIVKATLAGRGLVPVTSWYSGFLAERPVEDEWPEALPTVGHLVALGCQVMVYGECAAGPEGGSKAVLAQTPPLDGLDLQMYARRVTDFASRVQEAGLTLVYHPHVMMPVETVDEIDRFMSAAGEPLRLLLDTGHVEMAGGDYRVVMDRWWNRISHIHLKDIRKTVHDALDPRRHTFDEAVHEGVFTVPGDGDLDYSPLIKKIAESGYDGWLVVEAEQDPVKAPPLSMAKTGFSHVSGLLERHAIPPDRNLFLDRG